MSKRPPSPHENIPWMQAQRAFDMTEHSQSYPVTSDAFRTMKLWFEQQIENAQQDQISGFAERSERGTIRGEKAHSRHCAMFEALQMFLNEFGTVGVAQAQPDPIRKALETIASFADQAMPKWDESQSGEEVMYYEGYHDGLRAAGKNAKAALALSSTEGK